jgi:hypothetical protein
MEGVSKFLVRIASGQTQLRETVMHFKKGLEGDCFHFDCEVFNLLFSTLWVLSEVPHSTPIHTWH